MNRLTKLTKRTGFAALQRGDITVTPVLVDDSIKRLRVEIGGTLLMEVGSEYAYNDISVYVPAPPVAKKAWCVTGTVNGFAVGPKYFDSEARAQAACDAFRGDGEIKVEPVTLTEDEYDAFIKSEDEEIPL